jgi:hypothetical protein
MTFDPFNSKEKKYRMPNQTFTCTITLVIATSESNFPATGDSDKIYFAGTTSDYDSDAGTVKYWTGSSYTAIVGPRPQRPQH